MQQYKVALKGIRPFIMHWDNIAFQDELSAWRAIPENNKGSVKGDDRSPAWTWTGYVYTDYEHVVLPFENLRSCLMEAGKKVPKAKGRGSFKSEAVSSIIIEDMVLPFFCGGRMLPWAPIGKLREKATFAQHVEAVRGMGFDLLVRRAVVGQSKHVRVRPIFHTWSCEFVATILDDSLTEDVLSNLFRVAGRYVGIGDWRPGAKKSPGPYGQFDTVLTAVD